MPCERVEFAPRAHIPETDGAVFTPAGDGVAIWTKGYAENPRSNKISARPRMSGERAEMATCISIPETDGVVCPRAGDGVAIWTKRDAEDPIPMPCERVNLTTCVGIPETGRCGLHPRWRWWCHQD